MNVKDGNKLIADFNGYLKKATEDKDPYLYAMKHAYENGSLKYHESWDWLMPVIHEIGTYNLAYPDQCEKVWKQRIIVNIDVMWCLVVEFIQFLNSERKK